MELTNLDSIPVNGSEEEDVIEWEPSPPRTQVSRKRYVLTGVVSEYLL